MLKKKVEVILYIHTVVYTLSWAICHVFRLILMLQHAAKCGIPDLSSIQQLWDALKRRLSARRHHPVSVLNITWCFCLVWHGSAYSDHIYMFMFSFLTFLTANSEQFYSCHPPWLKDTPYWPSNRHTSSDDPTCDSTQTQAKWTAQIWRCLAAEGRSQCTYLTLTSYIPS